MGTERGRPRSEALPLSCAEARSPQAHTHTHTVTHLQKNMHRDTHDVLPLVFSTGIEGSVPTNHSHVFGEGWKECTFPCDTQIPSFASISGAENKWTWKSLPGLGSSFAVFYGVALANCYTSLQSRKGRDKPDLVTATTKTILYLHVETIRPHKLKSFNNQRYEASLSFDL